MSWSAVINQERVKDVLKRGIEQQRVAHAYLFYGPDGVGKRGTALAFAKTLQCKKQEPVPCDACDACRKVSRMVHPDVHVLFPYPSDATPQDVGERLKHLGENPYVPVDYIRRPSLSDTSKVSNKQAIFTVGRISQELRRAMSFKPVEGRHKVAILTNIEAMRQEAANAFLKLLEEPGPDTVFMLITDRPDKVLPTILSRCQRVRFDPLQVEHIKAALIDQLELAEEQASTLARMANGSFTRAIELAENEDLVEGRQIILDYFRYAFTLNTDKLSDIIDQLSVMGRERLKGILYLMLSWTRDLLLFKTMGDEALLINLDQKESIRRFCMNVPDANLAAMVRIIEQAIELIGRNVQINLILIVLGEKLHQAMHGKGEDPLYIPLDQAGPVHV